MDILRTASPEVVFLVSIANSIVSLSPLPWKIEVNDYTIPEANILPQQGYNASFCYYVVMSDYQKSFRRSPMPR
jgi:hypothetical protein